MVSFANVPGVKSFYAPTRFEADVIDCEITGTIPTDMQGAFFRLGFNWLYPPLFRDDTILSADGYISRFRFKNGRIDYRGRYVKTPRYLAQIKAGRQLYGYYRNPYTDDPSIRDIDDVQKRAVANTTPVIHAGKLYATKEDALPFEMDPVTLDTIGPTDFGGAWKSQTFTAHPKLDPATGEMIAYGYEATGLCSRDVFIYIFDKNGQITREIRCEVPYTTLLHDICITEQHVVIPGGGTVTSLDRLKEGKIHWGWDSSLPSFYGVIPRDGDTSKIRWFKGPERSITHTINAWTEGDKIIMDAPMASGNTWHNFDHIDGRKTPPEPEFVRRITLDLGSKDDMAKEEIIFPDHTVTNFSRMDDRYATKRNRYAFISYCDEDRPFDAARSRFPRKPVNCYGRFDLMDRTVKSVFAGDTYSLQEACFVPKAGGTGEEGEGYLVGCADNLADYRTELMIVDAQRMEEIGRVLLPFRTYNQVHCAWAAEGSLPLD